MSVRPFFGLLLAMGLAGCGGTATVYRGNYSSTQTANGATATSTVNGQTVVIYSGGEGGSVLVDLGSFVVQMTRSGDQLTAAPGQSVQETSTDPQGSSNSTQTINSGTGSLSGQNLTLTLSGTSTYSQGGGTGNATFTVNFTGQKI